MNKYPNRPHDLSNPGELKDALMHTVSTFMDYYQYVMRLDELIENFDETLEHADFSTWLRMGSDPESVDDLTANATMSLRESAGLFEELSERAKRNLILVLKALLAAPPDIQQMVAGHVYNVAPDEVDELFENIFMEVSEIEYQYAIPECFTSFMSFLHDFVERGAE